MTQIHKDRYNIDDLLSIMARLRSEQGCPWDREQTIQSLRSFLLEEAYEVLDAIETGDDAAHQEELGDVLFQIVFQSQVASQEGKFDFGDVVDQIARKIVGRHPHVFSTETANTAKEVVSIWERVKKEEKRQAGKLSQSVLDGVPGMLPSLLATHRISERAARVGFDWDNAEQVMDKVREELAELEQALGDKSNPNRTKEVGWEIGDLLFATANLARHLGQCGEDLLREANRRFKARFELVEELARQRSIRLAESDLPILEALWQEAKSKLNQS